MLGQISVSTKTKFVILGKSTHEFCFIDFHTIYTKHRHVPELNTSLRQSLNWICQMGLPNIKI